MSSETRWRIYELMRMRWQLLNRPGNADPFVIPAAVDFLSSEIEGMKNDHFGLGPVMIAQ
ncbi:hypothetical protein [Paenibacillus sinopodophylli]|uniref:hypothetical protein n=1 Tax=Paenibacillus sinopodophylli TaxID=1837342 RepID=UPI00110CD413|nr:hypothetical protein [Paenibacillus sinopodophylli]